jgi:hypothetical protein
MRLQSAIFMIFLFSMINIANAGIMAATHGGHTITEIYLSIAVLIFGLVIIGMQCGILYKSGKVWGMNSTRSVGITLVIISGLFLITAGYSQEQISPMIGLLGTIAGYLLGKTETEK